MKEVYGESNSSVYLIYIYNLKLFWNHSTGSSLKSSWPALRLLQVTAPNGSLTVSMNLHRTVNDALISSI